MSDVTTTTTTRAATPAAQPAEVRSFPTLPSMGEDPVLQVPGARVVEPEPTRPADRKVYSPLRYLADILRILLMAALPFAVIFLLYWLGR